MEDRVRFPSHLMTAAQVADRQAQICLADEDWMGVLAAWLALARQFPDDDAPMRMLARQFAYLTQRTRSGLATVMPVSSNGITKASAADVALLREMPRHLTARLEAWAHTRGIRIRERHHLHTGWRLLGGFGRIPGTGQRSTALYVETLLPTPVPVLPDRQVREFGHMIGWKRWLWPGRLILLDRNPTLWRPLYLADALGFHLVTMRQRYRRKVEIDRLLDEAMASPQRILAFGDVFRRNWEIPSAYVYAFTPAGRFAATRVRDALLVYLIRRVLR